MKRLLLLSLVSTSLIFSACGKKESAAGSAPNGGKKLTVAMLPKSKGNAYFLSAYKGAQKAADQLGDTILFDGPTQTDPAKQNEIVEGWINKGVDVIAVAAEDKAALSTALRKAQGKGIKVVSFDADVMPDARTFFVNQATPQGIGEALMDEAARLCNSEGEFAIITASLTAANQNEWKKHIDERLKTYPKMKLADFRPCDDDKAKAQQEATTLMSAHPNVKLIMSICSPGVPGAAEAVKQAGKTGKVKVIGLGLPNENKIYVHGGVTESVILWNTEELGALAVHAADAVARGKLKAGDKSFTVGDKTYEISGDNIMLGKPFIFNKGNIDQFDF
ncbi:MAG TPA: substrate-binding domain-containing protein [Opitutaceae bacterium]|nr:substrate-binding domain-containing protein [Opitutaceae bacterium]